MSAPPPILAAPKGESSPMVAPDSMPPTTAPGAATSNNSAPPAPPPAPMSHREHHAEARLEADEWDVEAWLILLQESEQKPFTQADALYKRVVERFPPYARFWRARAEHCIRDTPAPTTTASLGSVLGGDPTAQPAPTNPGAVIFEEAVKDAPTSVELWRAYTGHTIARAAPSAINSAIPIFERAVGAAGLDLHANALWNDYIDFLRNRAVLSDSQRRDALRRVFQRAVRTPMQHLDAFWRDYSQFEQKTNTNKEIGRVLLAEYQPKNVDARTEFRARKGRREGLALTALPVPPRGRAKEVSQAAQWRRFIAAERANPSSLPAEELHARVVHAFETALVPLYRYPDMWIEYISYLYDALLPPIEVPLVAGATAAAKRAAPPHEPAKLANAVTQLEPVYARAARALPACVALHFHVSSLWTRLGQPSSAVSVLDTLCKQHPSALAFVHLMRISRRVDGRDAARRVFARARKDKSGAGAHPAVYVAAANLEFCVNKDAKVARNVYEFGLKKHGTSALMALAFVEWLWGVGDFEYMRVVFEKVMPHVQGDALTVRRLWERWIDVEGVLGDSASIDRVEAMWQESGVGRALGVVQNVLRRCRFLGFEGMSPEEFAAVGAPGPAPGGSSGGKRDPRLGRRSGNATSGVTTSAAMPNGNVPQSTVLIAIERLKRLGGQFNKINGPPPAVDLVMSLIMKTPESFTATPAGGGLAALPNGAPPPRGAETHAGKRSRGEAIGGGVQAAPVNDVFRARQAAKQARLK